MLTLRRESGAWLRQLREARGFSQRQLAEQVGIDYYTFVSQIESGRGRIPADRYQKWAEALQIDPRTFVKNLLRFYEPATFGILFGQSADDNGDLIVHRSNRLEQDVASRNISSPDTVVSLRY